MSVDLLLSNSEMILFSNLTDFSYFPLKFCFRKLQDNQNRSKVDLLVLKRSLDGFSYLSLIFKPEASVQNLGYLSCFTRFYGIKYIRFLHIVLSYICLSPLDCIVEQYSY